MVMKTRNKKAESYCLKCYLKLKKQKEMVLSDGWEDRTVVRRYLPMNKMTGFLKTLLDKCNEVEYHLPPKRVSHQIGNMGVRTKIQ